MKLHILFGQRTQEYEGQHAPEALVCWDENCIDENPEGFEADCEKARALYAPDMQAMRVIAVKVDGDRIVKLLNAVPTVEGEVE